MRFNFISSMFLISFFCLRCIIFIICAINIRAYSTSTVEWIRESAGISTARKSSADNGIENICHTCLAHRCTCLLMQTKIRNAQVNPTAKFTWVLNDRTNVPKFPIGLNTRNSKLVLNGRVVIFFYCQLGSDVMYGSGASEYRNR